MTVQVFHVHLAHAPLEVRGGLADVGTALLVFLIDFIDVVDEDRHPRPRLALCSFTQKNRDIVPADAAERRRFTPVPGFLKAEDVDVVVHGSGEFFDVEDWGVGVKCHAVSFSFCLYSTISTCNPV